MTTLTTVHLDTHSRPVRAALRDVQQVHKLVLEAALTGEPLRRVLWANPESGILLIRHDRPLTGRDFPPGWVVKVQAHVESATLGSGARVRLAWVCNPARNKWRQDATGRRLEPPSRRTVEVPQPEWPEWARLRLEPMVGLMDCRITRIDAARGIHKDGNNPTLVRALVRATGVVKDAGLLAEKIREGMGRGRAYGCGLIVAREMEAA